MHQLIFKVLLVLTNFYAIMQIAHAENSKFSSYMFDNFVKHAKPLPNESAGASLNLEQYLQMSCSKKSIDRHVMKRTEECFVNVINDQRVNELVMLVVTSDFQKFGIKICKTWPSVRACLDNVIKFLEECHEKNYIGQVTDEIINHVCSNSNSDKNNLGDFFANGGMTCTNVESFSVCIRNSLDYSTSFCTMVEKIRDCAKPAFEGCVSLRPWEIVSNLLDFLEGKMNCSSKELLDSHFSSSRA